MTKQNRGAKIGAVLYARRSVNTMRLSTFLGRLRGSSEYRLTNPAYGSVPAQTGESAAARNLRTQMQ